MDGLSLIILFRNVPRCPEEHTKVELITVGLDEVTKYPQTSGKLAFCGPDAMIKLLFMCSF